MPCLCPLVLGLQVGYHAYLAFRFLGIRTLVCTLAANTLATEPSSQPNWCNSYLCLCVLCDGHVYKRSLVWTQGNSCCPLALPCKRPLSSELFCIHTYLQLLSVLLFCVCVSVSMCVYVCVCVWVPAEANTGYEIPGVMGVMSCTLGTELWSSERAVTSLND